MPNAHIKLIDDATQGWLKFFLCSVLLKTKFELCVISLLVKAIHSIYFCTIITEYVSTNFVVVSLAQNIGSNILLEDLNLSGNNISSLQVSVTNSGHVFIVLS